MASITLTGTLLDPTGEVAVGDQIRFTHRTTTGETIQFARSVLIIPPNGLYNITLEFGLIFVEYLDIKDVNYKSLGVVTVNGDTTATDLPGLLNAIVPPTDAQLLLFQGILADTEDARDIALLAAAQQTTLELIASTTTHPAGTVLTLSGYTLSGDGGGAQWKLNGVVGQPVSQSPAQLGDALLNDASGNQWALVPISGTKVPEINPLALGADKIGVADSHPAYAAAITALTPGDGGRIHGPAGDYRFNQPLVIDTPGILISGDGGGPFGGGGTIFEAWHVDGPVIHFRAPYPQLRDVKLKSSPARGVEPAGGNNIGLLFEPPDTGVLLIADGSFKRILIADQPDSGWVMSAGTRRIVLEQVYSRNCGGHAGAITNGTLTGRTNTSNAGIITVLNCSAESCGGNSLSIGDPGESTIPFRVKVINYEGSDSAFDAATRNSNDQCYIRASNIQIELCAWRGIQPSSQFSGGILAGGTNIEIINNRYVDTTYCVTVQTDDISTRGVKIDGLVVFVAVIGIDQPNAVILPVAGDARGVRVWAQVTITGSGITNLVSGIGPGLEIYNNQVRDISGDTTYNDRLSGGLLASTSRILTDLLTISSGVINITNTNHRVDTEGEAPDDLLTSITGGQDGDVICLSSATSSRTVTVQNNFAATENAIQCGANISLNSSADRITLERSNGKWFCVAFADNGT